MLLFLFFDRSMLFSWLGSGQREEDWTARKENLALLLLLLFLLFLAQAKEKKIGQVEEEQENPASSLLILLFLLSTFFLTQVKEKIGQIGSGESTTQQHSLLEYWEVQSITVWNHYVDRGWIPDSSWIVILKMWMKEILSSLHSLINSISIP